MSKKAKKESETPTKETVRHYMTNMLLADYVQYQNRCTYRESMWPAVHLRQKLLKHLYLSPSFQFEALPFEGKTPATVVLLLSSPEEDILLKACEAIHLFAEKGRPTVSRYSLLAVHTYTFIPDVLFTNIPAIEKQKS